MGSNIKQATLIYNPVSGSAQIAGKLDKFAQAWRKRGWKITVAQTAYAAHGTELARLAVEKKHAVVIAAGGDGTIRDVIQGLLGSETILAIMPCGTGNTFARDLNLMRGNWRPNYFAEMAGQLLDGVVYKMDIGICTGDLPWFMTLGVGIDSLAVQEIEPRIYKSWLSRRFNKLIYLYKGLKSLRSFPGMHASVRVDGQEISGDFLLVTVNNTRYFGGYLLYNPSALLDDGLCEVWMLRGSRKRDMVKHFWRIAIMRSRKKNADAVMLRGKDIEIDVSDVFPFQYDGDLGGVGKFEAHVQRQAVRVVVPDNSRVGGLFSAEGTPLDAVSSTLSSTAV